jgi:phage shock protein PspC (stress-responsive transcriptional regulator)
MAADHDHPGGYLLTIPAPRSSLRPRQASGLAGTVRLASQARIVKGGAVDPTRKLYPQEDQPEARRVCGGLAQYFNLDAMLIRVLFVVLAVLGGSGLVL